MYPHNMEGTTTEEVVEDVDVDAEDQGMDVDVHHISTQVPRKCLDCRHDCQVWTERYANDPY